MNIRDILTSDGVPACVSGSFTEYEVHPDPIWIYTNMMTDNIYVDDFIEKEVLHFTVAYYTSNPADMREIVKAKQKELLKTNEFLCGGIVDIKTKDPELFGLGFECKQLLPY